MAEGPFFCLAICILVLSVCEAEQSHPRPHHTASRGGSHQAESRGKHGEASHKVIGNEKLPPPLNGPHQRRMSRGESNDIRAYEYLPHGRYHNAYLRESVRDERLGVEDKHRVIYRSAGTSKSSAVKHDDVDEMINSVVLQGKFGEVLTSKTNKSTEYLIEYLYNATALKASAIRVTVNSNESDFTYPVVVVVRQQRGVLSWQLPLEPPPSTNTLEEYKEVSRTLCPVENYKTSLRANHLDVMQRMFVDVSTSSETNVSFTVKAEFINNFVLKLHESQSFDVTPSTPYFVEFQFPDHVDMILVKANAEDDFCAMVAIQNITCPVFDSEENIKYGNFYQTMTYQAGITIRKENYPKGLYVIVVLLSNDEPCSGSFQHIFRKRKKTVTLTIEEKITKLEYLAAIFAGLGFCAFFYIVTLVLACISYIRSKRKQPRERSLLDDSIITPEDLNASGPSPSYGAIESHGSEPKDLCQGLPRTVSDSSLDEDDIDMLTDAESDKDIFRTKTFLYVSDLARKDMRVLGKKSQLYIFGLITVGIFYAVPVIQLVITYQKVLDVTGNQDLCYYNFWCAHPLGPLSDFNHVFSNISYILFGILFIGVCKRRSHLHKQAAMQDYKIDKYYGIPQHYGIFYAMGGSLIMEGLLSGCYHICPNNSNYQFDTSFMYVISVMSMLKIYQTRHPDINASASAAFMALALAVVLGVIGVLTGTIAFWVIFGFIHVISCLLLSCNIYYMGRWKFDLGIFGRMKTWFMSELSDWRGICRPMYCDRMVLLLLGNAANWGLSIYGMVTTPKDFASYLLIIFLTNLLLYIAFYIIMKLRHRERIQFQPLIYLVLCLFGWSAAIFFYVNHTTTWELTPAHSRQFNQECVLLHFYDTHDIWHFFSAAAMFFGFMLLLTLDDDLAHTPREKIPVF